MKKQEFLKPVEIEDPGRKPDTGDAKECQVSEQLRRLEQAIEDAGSIGTQLESRLDAVLMKAVARQGEIGEKKELVPLASRIRTSALHVESIAAFLQDVINRLQV